MGLIDFQFKVWRLFGGGWRDKTAAAKPSWMTPISHGYHVVEGRTDRGGRDSGELMADSVVVSREQVEELELWFFGVFDARVRDSVSKYMQAHLFNRKLKKSQIRKKSKEATRKAYLGARAKIRETDKDQEARKAGSASVMVINGQRLVLANMGGYRAVVCRDGVAYQMRRSRDQATTHRHLSRRLISGAIRMFKAPVLACGSSNVKSNSKISEFVVGTRGVDSDTEFVILASTGIWEVMKNQEAVNLIRHLEDPQEAAECLSREALIRMSRNSISCIVIRFD